MGSYPESEYWNNGIMESWVWKIRTICKSQNFSLFNPIIPSLQHSKIANPKTSKGANIKIGRINKLN